MLISCSHMRLASLRQVKHDGLFAECKVSDLQPDAIPRIFLPNLLPVGALLFNIVLVQNLTSKPKGALTWPPASGAGFEIELALAILHHSIR